MATIKLSAYTCHFKQAPGERSKGRVFQIGAEALKRTKVEARNLSEIRAAVQALGKEVSAENLGISFSISVDVANGSRAPAGFKKADNATAFGTDDWMLTFDGYTQPVISA